MSIAVQHIAEELRALSPEDLRTVRALLDELVAAAAGRQGVYGQPLTDEDIAQAARVTFSALDADESKA